MSTPSFESLLLTRVLFYPEELEILRRLGFNADLLSPAYAQAFREIERFHTTHREFPTAKILLSRVPAVEIQREAPKFKASVYWESIHYYRWRAELLLAANQVVEMFGNQNDDRSQMVDLSKVTDTAGQLFAKISSTFMSEADRAATASEFAEELVEEYTQEEKGKILAVPIPFAFLQEELRGLKGGQTYVVAGRPKTGKSWFALICAAAAIVLGYKVLIVSLEMRRREILRRLACIISRVSFNRVMKRSLSPEEKKTYYDTVRSLKEGPAGKLIQLAGPGAARTPEAVYAMHRTFGAHMVVVDAFYKMESKGEKDWERVQALMRSFSRHTVMSDAVWMLVTQFNRGGQGRRGAHLGNLGFTDAIGQDAHAFFYLTRNAYLKRARQVDIILGEAREADDVVAFRHNWDFKNMRWDPIAAVEYGADDNEQL